ncbi:MAG: hemolysin D [Lysobacterales bacterium CG02_land_8_20_14_3_00_62_12]|nr:MAG: hemolysin D [Xanthomonadales bacterium CG02_land_8_20_14_3_00_62_12]
MSESLFRKEALAAHANQWLGGISLAQPLRLWLLALSCALAAAVVLAFLLFGQYTRRSHVTGQLVPSAGLITVMAPTTGVVSRLLPQEGDRIDLDAPLVTITVPRALASGGDATLAMAAQFDNRQHSIEQEGQSRDTLLAAQIDGIENQLAAARRELAQMDAEVATRKEQVRIASGLLQRYQQLSEQRFVSEMQVKQEQQALLEQVGSQQALERQAGSVRRNIAQLKQTRRELPAQRQLQAAAADRDLALLEQERVQADANSELLIKAPAAGLIANRSISVGQAVQIGQPLFTLLPAGASLQAQLLVPSRAIGFIAPGDTVLLRYQAFPYQKFGHHRGKVVRISRSALGASEVSALVGGNQASEPLYRVLVALDSQTITAYGKPEPLRPGMLVDADILGERRKLYEWVLEPLYSVRGLGG